MKLHFGHLVLFGGLLIAGTAAFFSVFGISHLFAGAFLPAVIMATALEFGKLVLASNLQRSWPKLGKIRRIYQTILVIFLMVITSAGIYGLLSSAYQKTYSDYTIADNKISFLKQKEGFYQSDVDRYDKEINQINNNITTLSSAKVSNIQVKDTSSSTGVRNTISTAELRMAQARISKEEANKKVLDSKRIIAIDSLNTYKMRILTLQNNTDVSAELGPLIYLKDLTGLSMNKVVNFFILLLIFVFDPMAIMLILESNRIFEDKRKEKEEKRKESVGMSLRSEGHIDEDGKVKLDKVISMDVVDKPLVNPETGEVNSHYNQEHTNSDIFLGTKEDTSENDEEDGITDSDINKAADTLMEDLMSKPKETPEVIQPTLKDATLKPVTESISDTEVPKPIQRVQRPPIPQKERPVARNGIVKPASNVGRIQITSDGPIKREDIKEIRENSTRGFTKKIPIRRDNK